MVKVNSNRRWITYSSVFPKCLVRSFMVKRSVLIGREYVGSNPTLPSKSTIRGLVCRNNIQVVDISERRENSRVAELDRRGPVEGFNRNYRFESCPDYNWDRDTQQIWHRFLNKDVADASNGFTEGVLGLIGRVPTHLLVMVDFLSGKTRRVFQ